MSDHGHGGGHDDHGHGGGHGGGHAPAKKDDKSVSLGAIWKDFSPLIALPVMIVTVVAVLLFWLLVKPAKWLLRFAVVTVLWHGGTALLKAFYHLMWDPLPARSSTR